MLLQTTLANKVDKLGEIEKLLERNSLRRLNQKEIENMSMLVTSNQTDPVIKKTSNKQNSRMRWLHRWLLRSIYGRVNTYSSEIIPKIYREKNIPISFYEVPITLIPKADKDTTQTLKRKLQANVTDEHRCKISKQNTGSPNSSTHYKNNIP